MLNSDRVVNNLEINRQVCTALGCFITKRNSVAQYTAASGNCFRYQK